MENGERSSCYVVLCYVMLCCVTLRCVVLSEADFEYFFDLM